MKLKAKYIHFLDRMVKEGRVVIAARKGIFEAVRGVGESFAVIAPGAPDTEVLINVAKRVA